MNFLWWIEFATKDSKGLFPMTFDSKQETGKTDIISTPSGVLANGRLKWHYVEDFFGNVCNFIDGIKGNYDWYDDVYSGNLSYSANQQYLPYVTRSLGWDSNHPFLCMPKEIGTFEDGMNTYFCDNGDISEQGELYFGGRSYRKASGLELENEGISMFTRNTKNYKQLHIGSRLLYCPNEV